MSPYAKSVLRCFKNNISRFVSISIIIFLGISFVAGLGTLSPQIKESFSQAIIKNDTADLIVKNTNQVGFSKSDEEMILSLSDVQSVQAFFSMEAEIESLNARLYILPIHEMSVNGLKLIEGEYPSSDKEILIDRASHNSDYISVGRTLEIMGEERTIVGVAENPVIFTREGEPDLVNLEPLEIIAYIDKEYIEPSMPATDLYVSLRENIRKNVFSDEYKDAVDQLAEKIQVMDETFVILTHQDNKAYRTVESYCDKIFVLSLIFPLFFIAVSALVVLTTMTRLIEEERPMIACLKTLGYSNASIAFKYVLFSLACCLISCALGLFAGIFILPSVIYPTFDILFFSPPMSMSVNFFAGLLATIGMFVAVITVTLVTLRMDLKCEAANILRPKAPKAGKKIFLERVSIVWKRLSFKYKSTFRNLFRYVGHLAMTVLSVAGSTALVLAGLALMNVANTSINGMPGNFSEVFLPIASVVVLFAVLLCVFVVYNLTNINISERKREIATLKVLGYHNLETSGYIYREIFFMVLFGVVLGIPLGVGLVVFLFTLMDFGAIKDVSWFTYLLAAIIVLSLVAIIDLLLTPKIRNIEMTSSLKSIE